MSNLEPTFANIGNELTNLLSSLTYPVTTEETTPELVFKTVLKGYPEKNINTFKGPVAVTYMKGTPSFIDTFAKHNYPEVKESVIGFVIKGTQTSKYEKAVNILDLIEEKFRSDHNWIKVNDTVRNTKIKNTTITPVEQGKTLSVLVVIELSHHVYSK